MQSALTLDVARDAVASQFSYDASEPDVGAAARPARHAGPHHRARGARRAHGRQSRLGGALHRLVDVVAPAHHPAH